MGLLNMGNFLVTHRVLFNYLKSFIVQGFVCMLLKPCDIYLVIDVIQKLTQKISTILILEEF